MYFRLRNLWIVNLALIWRGILCDLSREQSSSQYDVLMVEMGNEQSPQIRSWLGTRNEKTIVLDTVLNSKIKLCNRYLPYLCKINAMGTNSTTVVCLSSQGRQKSEMLDQYFEMLLTIDNKYLRENSGNGSLLNLETFQINSKQSCSKVSFAIVDEQGNLGRFEGRKLGILVVKSELIDNYNKTGRLQMNGCAVSDARLLQQNGNALYSSFSTYHEKCNERCSICEDDFSGCRICKVGYVQTQNMECIPTVYLYISSTLMSFSFGILKYPFLFEILFTQFALYEYLNLRLAKLKRFCQFLGSVNREKYIPLYWRNFFPTLYRRYQEWKYRIIPVNHLSQSSPIFLEREKKGVYIYSNMVDIAVWYLTIVLPLFLVFRAVNMIQIRLQKECTIVKKCSSWYFLGLVIVQAQSEYLMFMYWKNLRIGNYESGEEKVALGVVVVVGFIIIVGNIGGYAVCCYCCSQKVLKKIYVHHRHHTFQAMLVKFIDGSGRWMLIGIIQGSQDKCWLSMSLLLVVSILLSIAIYFYPSEPKGNFFLNKNLFVVVLDIFCIFGVFNHLNIGRWPEFHNEVQYLCLLVMLVLSVLEVVCLVMEGVMWVVELGYRVIGYEVDKKMELFKIKNQKGKKISQ